MPNLAEQTPLLEPGTVLAGKYRIDGVLGKGGMGVVVAATHLALDQRVALKFLLPAALESEEATERFAREARAAVRLRSEHVARVLDVGQLENGSPYMVMEFLEGQDLADRISSGERVTIPEAVDYVLQASEAVAEAHALGIIHRDLKPRNLFLTQSVHGHPLVKVLDFGISKTVGGPQELSLTRTSAIMGSPNYMSPEQLGRPRDVDGRSDLWSLGVILYELIAGHIPFRASTLTELCARVFQEEPEPLNEARSEVSAELAVVVQKCLAKKLDERYANVAEMARALAPFAPDPAIVKRIEQVAAMVPTTSAPRLSRSSLPSNPGLPSTAATSVSWSGAADLSDHQLHAGETLVAPRRGRLFPVLAAVGAAVVAIGAAAVTVTLTKSPGVAVTTSSMTSDGGALAAGGTATLPPALEVPDTAKNGAASDAAATSATPEAPTAPLQETRSTRPVRPPPIIRKPVTTPPPPKNNDINMADDRR